MIYPIRRNHWLRWLKKILNHNISQAGWCILYQIGQCLVYLLILLYSTYTECGGSVTTIYHDVDKVDITDLIEETLTEITEEEMHY